MNENDVSSSMDASTEHLQDMNLDAFRRTMMEHQERDLPPPPTAVLKCVPEVTDDYIRNFLLRNGMHQTLACFEVEWYERFGVSASSAVPLMPDNYLETAALLNQIEILEHDLRQHAELTTKATKQWVQARKDRDFHRANHNRVVQEKNRLSKMLQQATSHAEDINPTLLELRQRCGGLFKEKCLVTIERDRLQQKVVSLESRMEVLQAQLQDMENQRSAGDTGEADVDHGVSKARKTRLRPLGKEGRNSRRAGPSAAASAAMAAAEVFVWPADERPYQAPAGGNRDQSSQRDATTWTCQGTFTAHAMAVTGIAIHPRKPAVASCSDDGSWRLSTVPQGELIMSGEMHTNWVSSLSMHPSGTMIATGSGDHTVKLWDFAKNEVTATMSAHTDGVWDVAFQDSGLLMASAGLDATARIWDAEFGRCRQTLRGHVAAVNSVCWQPFTNILATASGDKTVSLWDTRMNCCSLSLYGHRNAVLSVSTVHGGEMMASCDADGVVKVWDVRKVEAQLTVDCGPYPANCITLDRYGRYAAVASDDALVKMIHLSEGTITELAAHEDAVQAVAFDPATNSFLLSAGSDKTVRYWS